MSGHDAAHGICHEAKLNRHQFFFIGNGASASMASHMAADWLKTVRVKAQCFNDAALVTALANDEGYENVFSIPLGVHCQRGDVLFAISSSGESENVIRAVDLANDRGLRVITLSGFSPDNRLRQRGEVNFWVDARSYGHVESEHAKILHQVLDRIAA